MKTLKYFLEFFIIILLFLIFKLLGRRWASNLGCFIATYVGSYFRSKMRIKTNLKKAFPQINSVDEKKYTKEMWCNFGRTFAEYVYLKKFRQNPDKHIKINGLEILDSIKSSGKSAVFISGHFANFELMAMELDRKGLNIAAIYRPLNNFFLNPLMEYWRKKYICNYQIPKKLPGKSGDGTRKFLKAVQEKTNIAVMVDQSVTQGKRIDFFNEKAFTTSIPSQLALKYNYQIIPISIRRVDKYQFVIDVFPPLIIDKEKDNEISIGEKINQKIEKMILKNPGQWIWTHNRWKI
jgi:Kdo2-lipid IVA lauroyltransferase/acyltransferase